MKKIINLYNRKRLGPYLELVRYRLDDYISVPLIYKLNTGKSLFTSESYDGEYVKGHPEKRTIFSVDPEGGPYLQVGYKIIDNIYVKSIEIEENIEDPDKSDYYITVEIKEDYKNE
jgi:hypothetical protein